MRFFSDGPDIPSELLNLRDEGNVVFLCGAGVSIPAGLPSFKELTEHVIKKLRVEKDEGSIAYKIWEQESKRIDEIFQALQNDYPRVLIDKKITEILSNKNIKKKINTHRIVSKISTNSTGDPQIVTTNFDRLFEKVREIKKDKCRIAPDFPDPQRDQLPPVTYLHGRLADDDENCNYVLSSADFGLAYLAENRATYFLLELLKKYTVVLLGYQADDPPIKYLLQGLSSANQLNSSRLFAFDHGPPSEVKAKWQDKGVTAIAYEKDDEYHQILWKTLAAWADRSDDLEAWNLSIVDLAGENPRDLKPHERGQVCHLVSTAEGAELFAKAPNTPPAEWLCVFDRSLRKSNQAYRLDNDPPYQTNSKNSDSNCNIENDNLLAWKGGDDTPTHSFRLIDPAMSGYGATPKRLQHLIGWIAKLAPSDPVVAWWIAGASEHGDIHPHLLAQISIRIKYAENMPKLGHQVWGLLLEYLEQDDAQLHERKWNRIKRDIKQSTSKAFILSALERATEPVLKFKRSRYAVDKAPPTGKWRDLNIYQIGEFSVDFRELRYEGIDVSEENLPAVFAILERNLIKGVNKLEEIGKKCLHVPTLYQDELKDADRITLGSNDFILWFVELLNRLANKTSATHATATHVKSWPIEEPLIFDKLRLYAWNKPKLFTPAEVVSMLLNMEPCSFWASKNDREFLVLLRDRWKDFDTSQREQLLKRLLCESCPMENPEHKGRRNAARVQWLQDIGGGEITSEAEKKLNEIKKSLPTEWEDSRVNNLTKPMVRIRAVRVNNDPSVLLNAPIHKIVELAIEHTKDINAIDHRPFEGLIDKNPKRALDALRCSAEKQEYPEARFLKLLWGTLIDKWPHNASERATKSFYKHIRHLPPYVMHQISYELGLFMRDKLPEIAQQNETLALKMFDNLIKGLTEKDDKGRDYLYSDTEVLGLNDQGNQISRKTINMALNNPIGQATEGLISIIDAKQLPQGSKLPKKFSSRLDLLLATTGTSSDAAICILTRYINWWYYIAPNWVEKQLIPLFSLDDSKAEPAWNGIFTASRIAIPPVFKLIKSDFLKLLPKMYSWNWETEQEKEIASWIVITTVWEVTHCSERLIYDEADTLIRGLSSSGRIRLLYFLNGVGRDNEEGWDKYVIPFIGKSWPRENKFQTQETSSVFVDMLSRSDEAFLDLLKEIKLFLQPIDSINLNLTSFYNDQDDEEQASKLLPKRFPEEILELIDIIVSKDFQDHTDGLKKVLKIIIKARPKLKNDLRYIRLKKLVQATD